LGRRLTQILTNYKNIKEKYMSSPIVSQVTLGKNIVGLEPNARRPVDWLRMVARVFTAYRANPLEKSIVAYIDGFDLTLISEDLSTSTAVIGITHGQAFVDDQFIGFTDDPFESNESKIKFNTGVMIEGEIYSVVLCYTWVDILPSRKPSFDIVKQTDIDPEHMLELGTMVKDNSGSLTLVDDKIPWVTLPPKLKTEIFTGDGTTCTFTIDDVFDNAIVFINGSRQRPGIAPDGKYIIQPGAAFGTTDIVFNIAPATNDEIIVDYIS
jgi:hypothetical protein